MSAPYYDLISKLEAAALAHVQTLTLAVGTDESALQYRTGLSISDRETPCILCSCPQIGPDAQRVAVFQARLEIAIISDANDSTLAAHRARVAIVGDAFMDTGIATSLSALATDFHAFLVICAGMRSAVENTEGGSPVIINTFDFDVLCCAATIT